MFYIHFASNRVYIKIKKQQKKTRIYTSYIFEIPDNSDIGVLFNKSSTIILVKYL